MFLHIGVPHVTEAPCMWYLESVVSVETVSTDTPYKSVIAILDIFSVLPEL